MGQSISLPAVMPGEPRNQLSCWRIAREREGGEWGSAPSVSWAKVNSQLGWIAGQLPQPYHSFSFCQKVLMEPLLANTSTASLLDWKMLKQPLDNWLLSERSATVLHFGLLMDFFNFDLWFMHLPPTPRMWAYEWMWAMNYSLEKWWCSGPWGIIQGVLCCYFHS